MQNVSIIGGGAVGTSMALLLSQKLKTAFEEGRNVPLTNINIYDAGGPTPYETPHWCNQPVSRMVVDLDTGAFARHISPWPDNNPDAVAHLFVKRSDFGNFYRERLISEKVALQNGQAPVRINVIKARVGNVEALAPDSSYPGQSKFRVHFVNGDSIPREVLSDSVILAPGHVRNRDLSEFRDVSGFIANPSDIAAIKRAAHCLPAGKTPTIHVRGASQSFVDAFVSCNSVFGANGYNMTAHASSFQPQWAFDPRLHDNKKDMWAYEFKVLDTEKFAQASLDDLRSWIEEEVRLSEADGIGRGLIYDQIHNRGLHNLITDPVVRACFINFLNKLRASPTPPERRAQLDQAEQAGTLRYQAGKITADDLDWNAGGHITLKGEAVDLVIDAACYAKTALANGKPLDPLLARMFNMLRVDEKTGQFVSGAQKLDGLWLAAGPQTEGLWGMESFLRKNAPMADKIEETLANRHFAIA